jgi:hypothetical protein
MVSSRCDFISNNKLTEDLLNEDSDSESGMTD